MLYPSHYNVLDHLLSLLSVTDYGPDMPYLDLSCCLLLHQAFLGILGDVSKAAFSRKKKLEFTKRSDNITNNGRKRFAMEGVCLNNLTKVKEHFR